MIYGSRYDSKNVRNNIHWICRQDNRPMTIKGKGCLLH